MAKMKRIVQNGFAFKAKNNVEERDNASKRKIDVMENSIVQMEKMNSTVLSNPDNGQRNKNVTQPMNCSVSLLSISLIPISSSSLSFGDEDRWWSHRLTWRKRWTKYFRLFRSTNVMRSIHLWSTKELSPVLIDLFLESNEMFSRTIRLCEWNRMWTERMQYGNWLSGQIQSLLVSQSGPFTFIELSINERATEFLTIRIIVFQSRDQHFFLSILIICSSKCDIECSFDSHCSLFLSSQLLRRSMSIVSSTNDTSSSFRSMDSSRNSLVNWCSRYSRSQQEENRWSSIFLGHSSWSIVQTSSVSSLSSFEISWISFHSYRSVSFRWIALSWGLFSQSIRISTRFSSS